MPKRNPRPRRPQTRPTRSRKPLLFLGGLLLGALVWFAPTIAVNSPLKNWALETSTSDFHGTVTVGSMSAGWLSPIEAYDVVAFDAQGERLAEIASVRVAKNLIALIGDRSDIGKIEVERPVLHLLLRPDGSNLEDAIAEYLKPSESSGSVGCEIAIVEGTVHMADAVSGKQWTAADLSVSATLPKDNASPLKVTVDSAIAAPEGPPANLRCDLLWQRPESSQAGLGAGNLSVRLRALPIEVTAPLAARFAPGLVTTGTMNGGVALEWSDSSHVVDVNGLSIEKLVLSAPQWIGQDQVKLASISATGKLGHRSGSWEAERLTIESDLGQLTAAGSAVVQLREAGNLTDELLTALRYGRFQMQGQIDLARLARMVPRTLHVRDGTQVSTGQLTIGLSSDSSSGGQRWDGRLAASNLSAMHEGRRLTWEQPIVVTVAASEADGAVNIEQLKCESNFLTVSAKGSSEAGSATCSGDFARLASELSKFADLGDTQLAGQLSGLVDWRKTPERKLQIEGSATANQFQLVASGHRPWREERLIVSFAGVGQPGRASLRAIDQATFNIKSGRDELALHVLPAPAGTVRESDWPVSLTLRGELASWLTRAQPFVALPSWSLRGAIDLRATADVSPQRVAISQSDVLLTGVQVSNGSISVSEPQVQIKVAGTWDQATSTFTSPDTTFASSTIAMRAADVVVKSGEASHAAGNISYVGDLGRLFALLGDPAQPATQQLAGKATGQLQVRHTNEGTSGEWSADITDFAYRTRAEAGGMPTSNTLPAERWSPLWEEPRLKLGASFAYDPTTDTLQIPRIDAAGGAVTFAAQGSLKEPASRALAELNGQIAYDLQQLNAKLGPQLGESFRITGRGTRPFSFQGPLVPQPTQRSPNALQPVSISSQPQPAGAYAESFLQMMAQASLGWTSASIQGFEIGEGELDAQLSQGILQIQPVDLRVSEGRVTLAPQIFLERSPMVMTLPKGPVAQQVRLSPEMCGTWLKYVTPLLADATSVQGSFSLSLEGATIPLDSPSNGSVEGTLELHQGQIGPSPMSQQLLWLAGLIEAIADGRPWDARATPTSHWLDLPPQRVAFRMADQRVFHQGLEVAVKDVVIRTRGSVGSDQTLALVAEVPVRDEWVARSRYLSSLRGQVLQIPIQGTLTKPRLDQRAIQQITQQTAVGAATGLIQDELNKQLGRGLEKLFGPLEQ